MAQSKRGRPKGALNKITNEAKRAILMAFDQLGGVERLVKWVDASPENEALYWTRIFPRLLPRPATDVVAAPEASPPVRGALTWKTPEWAKNMVEQAPRAGSGRPLRQGSGQALRQSSGQAELRAGVADAACVLMATATGDGTCDPPGLGPPPSGWVAPG